MEGKLELYEAKLGQYQVRLQYLSPESRLRENRERTRLLEQSFRDAMERNIQNTDIRLVFIWNGIKVFRLFPS